MATRSPSRCGSTAPTTSWMPPPRSRPRGSSVSSRGSRRMGSPRSTAATPTFSVVPRRFELRGRARDADFFDDYGQTPTEMAVTIATARRRAPARLIALVQPHRYWRVQGLWRELGASVAGPDVVVVTDVYGAAQPPIPGVTGRLVADGVVEAVAARAHGVAPPAVSPPHRRA